jgi:glycosyltransferase involved in cell wall biosynthesis
MESTPSRLVESVLNRPATPRLSVVIATYNRAPLLKVAIDSVLSQTYQDYELIVADDGSSDDTAELVSSYAERGMRGAERIHYFYQKNQGKSVALNNAIAQARGEWIAFLDSDDYWLAEKLERQFAALEHFQGRCGACFTDGQFVNNPHMDTTAFRFYGRSYEEAFGMLPDPSRLFAETPAGVSIVTLLCRTELLGKAGGFDPDFCFTEDYDFIFRLSLVTGFCFVNAPLVIIDRSDAQRRHSGTSAIWDKIDFRLQCEQRRYEKWVALTEQGPASIKRILRGQLRKVHSGWANFYLAAGRYELAQEEMSKAMKYEVTPGLLVKNLLARLSPRAARTLALRRGFDAQVF